MRSFGVSSLLAEQAVEASIKNMGKNNVLQFRHNERDVVSNRQCHDCLLNRLFRRRSKKTKKLRVTGLCEGNSPMTGEFPAKKATNAENVSIWWRHHIHVSARCYNMPTTKRITTKLCTYFPAYTVCNISKVRLLQYAWRLPTSGPQTNIF